MKKIITTFSLLFVVSIGFSQNTITDDLGTDSPALQAKKGTYEIIVDSTKGNDLISITPAILKQIERNRKESTYVYLDLAPSVKVKIYPKDKDIVFINTSKDEK